MESAAKTHKIKHIKHQYLAINTKGLDYI